MKVLILLNEGAGTLAGMDNLTAKQQIRRAFTDQGSEADVRFVEARKLEQVAKEAIQSDVDAIIAGGGDGTLNTIANAIASSRKVFGVLPLGTHNHFAKDLNMPLELNAAVAALALGNVVDVPVAEVNGRIFLNFSALGLHPNVIRDREKQMRDQGRKKWPAMALATARQLAALPVHQVTLSSRGHTVAARTPSVIICNNPHQMKVFGVEDASVPERGLLNVYVTTRPTRTALVRQLFTAAANRISDRTRDFQAMALPQIQIDSRRKRLAVSIDGEVVDMKTPLLYRIHERPLRVLVPPAPAT